MTIPRPLAIILFVALSLSLAANFVLAGFAGARFLAPRGLLAVERLIEIGARTFPAEIRPALVARAVRDRAALTAAVAELRSARQRAFAALKAEPFDKATAADAFSAVREKTDALQRLGQTIVIDAVGSAPADIRAKIVVPGG